MDESLSDWLAVREPADLTARSATLVERVRHALASTDTVRGLDLCTGTGSNLRYLIDRLPGRQTWLAADRDARLLEELPTKLKTWADAHGYSMRTEGQVSSLRGGRCECDVETRAMDLDRLDAGLFEGRNLVTASALLDLVSDEWLQRLVVEIAARRLPFYAALSYDGRVEMTPADSADKKIIAAVNAHQRIDKGFGPALGPTAAAAAVERFERVGYSVLQGQSDWVFAPHDREIQLEMLSGWAAAARDVDDVPLPDVIGWLKRRRDLVVAGQSSTRVGHTDLFARPTATR